MRFQKDLMKKVSAMEADVRNLLEQNESTNSRLYTHDLILNDITGKNVGISRNLLGDVQTELHNSRLAIEKIKEEFRGKLDEASETRVFKLEEEQERTRIQLDQMEKQKGEFMNALDTLRARVEKKDPGNRKFMEEIVNELTLGKFVSLDKSFNEELNKLWVFVQEFVNEQGFSKVRALKHYDVSSKDKHDGMEWLARNAEFVASKVINEAIGTFREIASSNASTALKTSLINGKHTSEVIATMAHLIKECCQSGVREHMEQLLLIYLRLLEPLLYSDHNVDKALFNNLPDVLLELVRNPLILPPHKKEALIDLAHIARSDVVPSIVTYFSLLDEEIK